MVVQSAAPVEEERVCLNWLLTLTFGIASQVPNPQLLNNY
jgi:hypothetical protein